MSNIFALIIPCIIEIASVTNNSRCMKRCYKENIYFGITSYKILLEVRLKDKVGNYISLNQMGLKFFSLNFAEVLEKSTSKA